MKRKKLILGCLAFAILLGNAVWLFAPPSSSRISVTFVGYTNDATGLPLFGYATSNISHAGFAVLRADNASRSTFSSYVGPIFVHRAGTAEVEAIPLKGAVQTAVSRSVPLTGHDFQLLPGASATFAVPAPDFHGKWQFRLSLTHIYNYQYRWQYDTVVFAQRFGLHFCDKGHFAMSKEIVR